MCPPRTYSKQHIGLIHYQESSSIQLHSLCDVIKPGYNPPGRREAMGQTDKLVLGLLLAGCARDAPAETGPADQGRVPPLVGEPCALSSRPVASPTPPRIFVELATLEGDIAVIEQPNAAVEEGAAAPRTFSQVFADPRWKAISVRHVIASDGVRQTFPWDFGPPRASTECPANEPWELSMTPYVTGHSPVMVRVDVQLLPAPRPGAATKTSQVPPGCTARTSLVVRDQQVIVLSGFPPSAGARAGLVTTVTSYVVWEDADLQRLVECQSKRARTKR
jgi:hypothetical protein